MFQDLVGDDDGRNTELVKDVEYLGAEEVEIVLNDGHVTLIQQLGACGDRCGRTVDELSDDGRARRLLAVGNPNHANVRSLGGQTIGQPRAEGGEPAWRRRKARQHADGRIRTTFRRDMADERRKTGWSVQGVPDWRMSPKCPACERLLGENSGGQLSQSRTGWGLNTLEVTTSRPPQRARR
jgi:hypothetical protein